jgi:hypothetical protein
VVTPIRCLACKCVSAGQGKSWNLICVVARRTRQSDSRPEDECAQWQKDTCSASRLCEINERNDAESALLFLHGKRD